MIERIYILSKIIIIKSEVWAITHCLGLGHETMVCAVCISIFLYTGPRYTDCILHLDVLCSQMSSFKCVKVFKGVSRVLKIRPFLPLFLKCGQTYYEGEEAFGAYLYLCLSPKQIPQDWNCGHMTINELRPQDWYQEKWPACCWRHSLVDFLGWKLRFDQYFTEICFQLTTNNHWFR